MNYYSILEVAVNASEEVIKGAYKALVKKYHPDANNGIASNDNLTLINEAFEVLSNTETRREYDLSLDNSDENKVKLSRQELDEMLRAEYEKGRTEAANYEKEEADYEDDDFERYKEVHNSEYNKLDRVGRILAFSVGGFILALLLINGMIH